MFCPSCGKQFSDEYHVCPHCGKFVNTQSAQPAQQPAQPQQQYAPPQQQYAQPQQQYAPPQAQYAHPQAQYAPPQQPGGAPRPHLECDRSWIKVLLLSMVTCGIYGIITYCKLTDDVNTICRPYDNKTTMNYFLAMLLGSVTCGIYPIVWIHNFCNRIGDNLKNRGIATDFSASTFWLWGVLGSFIFVGPFIFMYKMFEATNQLAADYNARG